MTVEPKGRIGSAFDDLLKDEGIFEEVQAGALKKVVAHRLGDAMKAQKLCPESWLGSGEYGRDMS